MCIILSMALQEIALQHIFSAQSLQPFIYGTHANHGVTVANSLFEYRVTWSPFFSSASLGNLDACVE